MGKYWIRGTMGLLGVLVAGSLHAAPIQWAENGHYYEYISPKSISAMGIHWADALAAAAGRSYLGMTGYLATITSQSEQNFLLQTFPINGDWYWIAGSDAETEGTWKWVAGPEAGEVFYIRSGNQEIGYNNWHPAGTINGRGDFLAVWGLSNNYWMISGEYYSTGNPRGYFIEYSGTPSNPTPEGPKGVPEPGTLALLCAAVAGTVSRRRKRA